MNDARLASLRRWLPLLEMSLGVLVIAACGPANGDEDRGGPPTTIIGPDANVSQVTVGHSTSAVLVDSPLVLIGGGKDSSGNLSVIHDATVVRGSRILVSVNGAYRLHLFNSHGAEIGAFGRKGAGPGEFKYWPDIYLRRDSIIVVDVSGGVGRVSIWNEQLHFVREFPVHVAVRFDVWAGTLGVFPDGSVAFMSSLGEDGRVGRYRVATAISSGPTNGSDATTIVRLAGDERYGFSDGTGTYIAFGKIAVARVVGNDIVTGTNDGAVLDVWTSRGIHLRRLVFNLPAIKLTSRDRTTFGRQLLSSGDARYEAQTRMIVARMKYAAEMRPYDAIYARDDGGFWLQLSSPVGSTETRFVVVAPNDSVASTVVVDKGFTPLWIGMDSVLLKGHDTSDRPFVGLYRVSPILRR